MTTESLRTTPEQRTYIRTLIAKHGGLSNEQLVKLAEAQASPIHDLFTWNNRRAGHLYRLRQAARILRSYAGYELQPVKPAREGGQKVRIESNKIPLAVPVRPTPGASVKWIQTSNALEDEFMKRQVIEQRLNGVKNAIKQLRVVPELEDLYQQLSMAIERYRLPALSNPKVVAVRKRKSGVKEMEAAGVR